MVGAVEMREGARAEALAREHARLARQNLEHVLDEDRSLIRRVPALSLVNGFFFDDAPNRQENG